MKWQNTVSCLAMNHISELDGTILGFIVEIENLISFV